MKTYFINRTCNFMQSGSFERCYFPWNHDDWY